MTSPTTANFESKLWLSQVCSSCTQLLVSLIFDCTPLHSVVLRGGEADETEANFPCELRVKIGVSTAPNCIRLIFNCTLSIFWDKKDWYQGCSLSECKFWSQYGLGQLCFNCNQLYPSRFYIVSSIFCDIRVGFRNTAILSSNWTQSIVLQLYPIVPQLFHIVPSYIPRYCKGETTAHLRIFSPNRVQ